MTDTVTGTIVRLKRRSNTPSGNPRWEVVVQYGQQAAGWYRIADDAAANYQVEGLLDGPEVRFEIDHNQIIAITNLDGSLL